MRRPVVSIRWKMMIMVIASGAAATIGTLILMALAATLYGIPLVGGILSFVNRRGGTAPTILGTAAVLFISSFVLLSGGTLRYVSMISKAVNQIAGGDLDVHIPVQSSDELGRLAGDINQMADRLKRSIEEEREAERSKNDLITSVSHDLRTPLTSILGYLELVDNDKYEDEVALRHYVSIAHDKTRSLKMLIDDLFEFTRVNHQDLRLNSGTVNLGRMLEQLAEESVPMLRQSGMEYRLSLPANKVIVQADPSMLVRVFENLISNAARYGSAGRFVDIELVQSDGWAVARVANYGDPIPESQLSRVFERFVRIEGSRSRDTGGAGLGLAIAKSIVELHGGSIRAYSEGRRTVFEVRIK